MRAMIHVGPWKTGTSSIQAMLTAGRLVLAEYGIEYHPDFGTAHSLLANALNESPDETLPPPPDYVGTVGVVHLRVFSSEHFATAEATKVDEWARIINAESFELIAGVREPMEWMVSLYLQHARLEPVPFKDFISGNLESRNLMLSSLMERWAPAAPSWRFMVLSPGDDAVVKFIELAGFQKISGLGGLFRENVTWPLPEELYTVLLVKRSLQYLQAMTGGTAVRRRLDHTELEQMLLRARPAHEYAEAWTVSDLIDAGALSLEPCAQLLEWRKMWVADAIAVAQSMGEAGAELAVGVARMDDPAPRQLWPTPDFLEALPIDAAFEVLCRTLAVSLDVGRQS